MTIEEPVERVAALYDIHGNLPALDAVLRAVAQADVSLIIVGGDVALGPMPSAVLERLAASEIPVRFLRGNCDRLVTDAARGALSAALPAFVRERMEWTAAQLSPRQRELLADLPTSLRVEIAGRGVVHFCHATPRSDEEIVTPRTSDEHVRAMFFGVDEPWIVCGHTHVQFTRRIDRWELMNAGSVGMSTGPAEAHWLLLDAASTWQRTRYDAALARDAIAATSYPGAGDFIDEYIDHAPTPEATWARLEPASQ